MRDWAAVLGHRRGVGAPTARRASGNADGWQVFVTDPGWSSDPGSLLPVVRFRPARRAHLAPGWYLCEVVTSGTFVPSLVIDFGDGFEPAERSDPAVADPGGRRRFVMAIGRTPRALGMASTDPRGMHAVRRVAFRRIPRWHAALEVVRASVVHERWRAPLAAAALVGGCLGAAIRHGRQAAAIHMLDVQRRLHARANADYDAWLARFATPAMGASGPADASAESRPTVSMLFVACGSMHRIQRTIESVRRQHGGTWSLHVALPDGMSARMRAWLIALALHDPRIHLVPASAATPGGALQDLLASATGDVVAVLDAGDALAPDALGRVSTAFRNPTCRLLYTDDDRIDRAGRRHAPHFKPDWGPDSWLSTAMLAGLTAIDRNALRGCRSRLPEAGDAWYDLLLQALDSIESTAIVHLPHVLCHRDASAASRAQARPRIDDRAAAVRDRCDRNGTRASVAPAGPHGFVIGRTLGADAPPVDVIVPTRDRLDLLARCLDGVMHRTRYRGLRLWVVDNDSREPATHAYLDDLSRRGALSVIPFPGAFNFARMTNAAVALTSSPVVCLLNNDIDVVEPGWLEEMVAHAMRPGVGAVGAFLQFPDGRVQHAGVVTGLNGIASHVHHGEPADSDGYHGRLRLVQNYSAVTAACMVFRREHFDAVGGFDERLRVCYNDVDFCLELRRRGLHNVWTPRARLLHLESASRGADSSPAHRARHRIETRHMVERWGRALLADPAYSPNLSLQGQAFDLALPPRPGNANDVSLARG